MPWEALAASAELLGAVAVVFSLVYLGIQARSYIRVARGESERSLMLMWDEAVHRPWQTKAGSHLMRRGMMLGYESLDEDEVGVFSANLARIVNGHYTRWRTLNKGLVDRDFMPGADRLLASYLNSKAGSEWWSQFEGAWPAEYEKRVTELLETYPHSMVTSTDLSPNK